MYVSFTPYPRVEIHSGLWVLLFLWK